MPVKADGPQDVPRTRIKETALERPTGRTDAVISFLTRPSLPLVVVYAGLAAAFMMVFLQGDILYNSFVANEAARGHLNVYAYFGSQSSLRWLSTVMPPLYYLTTALYLKILMILHLDPVTSHPKEVYVVMFGLRHGLLFSFGSLLLKLPNVAAIVVGLILSQKLARDSGADARVVALLWAASPALIVGALMQAQNDAIATATAMGALVAFRAKGPTWMMVLIGLAACFKSYALILIPVTAILISNRNLFTAVKYGLTALVPPVLISLPFLGHAFLHRLFGAHDSGTLLGTAYTGRLPTHFWPILYVGVFLFAWFISQRKVQITDILGIWFLALAPIFIVNWWLPQWLVWLLPMAIVFAARDRIFAWLWVLVNAAVLANDLFDFPANMDGGMLMPIFGEHHHAFMSHYYAYHLYLLYRIVPYGIRDGVYMLAGAGFIALCIRVIQWVLSRSDVLASDAKLSAIPSAGLAALVGPLLLLPYIGTMVVQRLTG
jgi:hypothetical protein